MRLLFLSLFSLLLFALNVRAQTVEVGGEYGRAYFFYNHRDYGTGLRKSPASNYNFIVGLTLQRNFVSGVYWKTGLNFTLYQQYYSTRKYWGAFEEAYPVILFPALVGHRTSGRLSLDVNAGLLFCLMPDQYDGEFGAIFLDEFNTVDSITRGDIKRDFIAVFPLLNINAGLRYAITPSWAIELSAGYAKGFVTITEYDIYYNNGSGRNDQRAKQWGKGDFANLSVGLKYSLKQRSKR